MKALGGFLRWRYAEARSAWPQSASSSSSSRPSPSLAGHCANTNNACANLERKQQKEQAASNAAAVALPSFLDTVGPESLLYVLHARALTDLYLIILAFNVDTIPT